MASGIVIGCVLTVVVLHSVVPRVAQMAVHVKELLNGGWVKRSAPEADVPEPPVFDTGVRREAEPALHPEQSVAVVPDTPVATPETAVMPSRSAVAASTAPPVEPSPRVAETPRAVEQVAAAPPPAAARPHNPPTGESALSATIPPARNGAKLVFVFDDAGQNMAQLEQFVTLPFPVTVAVLPKIAHSAAAAARVRSSGNEVLLHQPMQAINLNINPGPGAILPDMSLDEIGAVIRENIREIGPVAGMNNHEGSLISEDEFKIGRAMQVAHEAGVFYLDSRTTSQTRVPQAAMGLGIGYYERNVFLDNTKKREDILHELRTGLSIANTKGAVIMIGHVWSADVLPAILRELYPILRAKGYTFTTVSTSGALIRP
ncbi:MAG: divergent polysaccharide deacetylase family protein [Treponema sp.]|nr:divergent polysaccharide deacetylase family protein [Treponema sp.]